MTFSSSPLDCSALEREARRLCQRYIDEVVLPFDLCPWAAPALRDETVEIITFSGLVNDTGEPLENAVRWTAQTLEASAGRPHTDLVLLLYPRFEVGRGHLDALLRALRSGQNASPFVMAAFHPEAALDTTSADRLVPYLRRSPDPMIQALRAEALDRINPGRGAGTAFVPLASFLAGSQTQPSPSPRERVALANLERVRRGASPITRALESIHEDRHRTYRALGYWNRC